MLSGSEDVNRIRFWLRLPPPSQVSSKHEVHLYWYFSKTSIFWSLNAHIWRHNRGTNSIRTSSFHDWPFARHFPSIHNTYLQWKNLTFSASAVGRLCHSIRRERERDTVSQSEELECSKRPGESERRFTLVWKERTHMHRTGSKFKPMCHFLPQGCRRRSPPALP